jgi:hypothetical protein
MPFGPMGSNPGIDTSDRNFYTNDKSIVSVILKTVLQWEGRTHRRSISPGEVKDVLAESACWAAHLTGGLRWTDGSILA